MTEGNATPAFFKSEGKSLFGWIHHAKENADLGLVICNPFGYEAICAHRSIKQIASKAAETGIPSIRFDYLNTGDSEDVGADENLLDQWVANIHAAADVLRKSTGVGRIVILGVRLGGALAALALKDRSDIEGYVAIEPVISGRAYLRELRALQSAFGATSTEFEEVDASNEVLGFGLSEASREALIGIDLRKLSAAPPSKALVFSRDGIKDAMLWVEQMRAAGSKVTRMQASGYVEMMQDPHKAIVPTTMIDQAIDWIHQLATALRNKNSPQVASTSVAEAGADTATVNSVVEHALWITGANRLFAILTEPGNNSENPAHPLVIILLNAGATHHVGPNRMYVSWARAWAAAGHTVMRIDLNGLGDSEARSNSPQNIVYPKHACENVLSAVSFLQNRRPREPVIAVGLCSGAFHALQAAQMPGSVDGIVMINPLTYFWNYDLGTGIGDLETSKRASQRSAVTKARNASFSLVFNRARLKRAGRHLLTRTLQRGTTAAREICRLIGIPIKYDLSGVLHEIAQRRIAINLIFSANDPGLDLLSLQGGVRISTLIREKQISLLQIKGADHTMTLTRKQRELTDAVGRHLQKLSQSQTTEK